MLDIMSSQTAAQLMSFPVEKKVVFLVLLYERMVPALYSFLHSAKLSNSAFEAARSEFWRWIASDAQAVVWMQVRQDLLNAAPDSEDYGSLEATFALNAALVAADIAGFIADRNDSHVGDVLTYVFNSLGSFALNDMSLNTYDATIVRVLKTHPIVQSEGRKEDEDVAFLTAMPSRPWSPAVLSILGQRATTQSSLFEAA